MIKNITWRQIIFVCFFYEMGGLLYRAVKGFLL